MVNRGACERRVYRLATLLTGNPVAAAQVISAVLDAQPDLSRLDSVHLDRLTVLRSREIDPGLLVGRGVPAAGAAALAALRPQQREAWVFVRIYGLTPRDAARAMDCSLTAMQRHLAQADAAVAGAVPADGTGAAASALREYTLGLDVPAFHRAARRRREAQRRVLALLGAASLAAAALAVGWLMRGA